MPTQTIPHLSHDTTKAILAALVEIPQFGAEFYTVAGAAATVAMVLMAPGGGGLSRNHRRLAKAHPVVMCTVRGETWRPAPSPADFHQVTLRWMVDNATDIGVWSAEFPEFCDDVAQWGVGAANNGAFLLTIETTIARVSEWVDLVQRWKKRSASLRVFCPESAGAPQ